MKSSPRKLFFNIAFAVFLGAVSSAFAAPVKIRLGTLAPNGSSYYKHLQVMGEEWRKAPGGGATLTIYPDGTMGGEGQPQTQAALLTRIVDFGFDLQAAIEAPRWLLGRTWGAPTSALYLEERVPREVVDELRAMGHPVEIAPDWSDQLGHAQAVALDRQRGVLLGGADPRGDGSAVGF